MKKLSREELLKRIWIDPERCGGKPCIRGHRIWVSLILDLLASGSTAAEVLKDYPGLVEEDIRACIAYGSEMARANALWTSRLKRTRETQAGRELE
jgi:uncharacterized protein (DUF433 family)